MSDAELEEPPAKLDETLAYVLTGLFVLRDMCAHMGLQAGRAQADQMIQIARADLKRHAPYPFCLHPEKCIPTRRCMSEPVCND